MSLALSAGMSDAAAPAAETATPAAKPAGGSKIVPILVVVNSLLVAGVLAVVLLRAPAKPAEGADGHAAAEAAAKPDPALEAASAMGPTVKIADFVIHLRNPEADRYARLSFEIELAAELDKEKATAAMPRLRDAFIVYLSDRTVEELRGSDGLQRVKTELLGRAQKLLPTITVRNLFITEFVVQ